MLYLDSTYQEVCFSLLRVAQYYGFDHSGDYIKRAEEAREALTTTAPTLEQLKDIAITLGYSEESYNKLIENCHRAVSKRKR